MIVQDSLWVPYLAARLLLVTHTTPFVFIFSFPSFSCEISFFLSTLLITSSLGVLVTPPLNVSSLLVIRDALLCLITSYDKKKKKILQLFNHPPTLREWAKDTTDVVLD